MSYHCPNFAIEKIEYQMKNVNHIVWADLIRVIAILMVICTLFRPFQCFS